MDRVVVATDGACLPNPGPGGWAWTSKDGSEASGFTPDTTNNVMELTAIKEALLAYEPSVRMHIQSDSQYAINCLTVWWKGWQRKEWCTKSGQPVKNKDLIVSIVEILEGRDVTWEFVRGHNGHLLNERADALANSAATEGDYGG